MNVSEEGLGPNQLGVPNTAPVGQGRAGRRDLRRDKATMQLLEQALIAGNTYKNAAILSGIGERSFFRWKAEGELATPRSLAGQFWQVIKRAEAEAVHRSVMIIAQAAKKNWTAAAWFLERKHPEDWARRDYLRSELSGPGGGPVQTANLNVNADASFPFTEEEIKRIQKRNYERSFGLPHAAPVRPGELAAELALPAPGATDHPSAPLGGSGAGNP